MADKYLNESGLGHLVGRIKDYMAPLIIGTQTAATGSWTGVAPFDSLEEGQMIRYYLPFNGSGNASLTLTLPDSTTTDAIPVYSRGTSRVTTDITAGSIALMTYYDSKWQVDSYYYNSTPLSVHGLRIPDNVRPTASGATIYGSQFVFQCVVNGSYVWRSITNMRSTGTGSTKVRCTDGIEDPRNLFYYNSGTAAASGSQVDSAQFYIAHYNVDFRYSSKSGSTLDANKFMYLVFTRGSDGLFYLDTTWWSQDLPTTDDGKIYMLLGKAWSETKIGFYPSHPMYWFKDGMVRPYGTYGDNLHPESITLNSVECAGHATSGKIPYWSIPTGIPTVPATATFSGTIYLFHSGVRIAVTDVSLTATLCSAGSCRFTYDPTSNTSWTASNDPVTVVADGILSFTY